MSNGASKGGAAIRLAWTGLGGIGLFVVTVVALHFLQPSLKPLDEAISYYVHGPRGWLLTVGLVGLGTASLATTAVLTGAVGGPGARLGRGFLAVWSFGVLLGGLSPRRSGGSLGRAALVGRHGPRHRRAARVHRPPDSRPPAGEELSP